MVRIISKIDRWEAVENLKGIRIRHGQIYRIKYVRSGQRNLIVPRDKNEVGRL